jgi:hypothetical protein
VKLSSLEPDPEELLKSYLDIKKAAQKYERIEYTMKNEIIDLTYIDPSNLLYKETSYLGTSRERTSKNILDNIETPSLMKGLMPRLITDPLLDDRNHNVFKSWVPENYLIQYIKGLGDIAKVSIATLGLNSWWPGHYDFDHNQSCKINIPILSNSDAFSLSWRPKEKRIVECNMKEGEVWWLNTGLKHSAVNWGETPRTFLLVTFQTNNFFRDHILENY